MNNEEKYRKVFRDIFEIREEEIPGLEYQAVQSWDSVGHMSLIAALESTFGIMMDTDDIINFSSYEKGKEILSRYDISF